LVGFWQKEAVVQLAVRMAQGVRRVAVW